MAGRLPPLQRSRLPNDADVEHRGGEVVVPAEDVRLAVAAVEAESHLQQALRLPGDAEAGEAHRLVEQRADRRDVRIRGDELAMLVDQAQGKGELGGRRPGGAEGYAAHQRVAG